MNGASGLTDNLLIRIGKDCPHMQSLDLRGHLELTDKACRALSTARLDRRVWLYC